MGGKKYFPKYSCQKDLPFTLCTKALSSEEAGTHAGISRMPRHLERGPAPVVQRIPPGPQRGRPGGVAGGRARACAHLPRGGAKVGGSPDLASGRLVRKRNFRCSSAARWRSRPRSRCCSRRPARSGCGPVLRGHPASLCSCPARVGAHSCARRRMNIQRLQRVSPCPMTRSRGGPRNKKGFVSAEFSITTN